MSLDFSAVLRPPRRDLAGALGRIDGMVIAEVWGSVVGWMVHPIHRIERVRLLLNGAVLGEADTQERADVGGFFPGVAHAAHGYFHVQGKVKQLRGQTVHVQMIGLSGGQEVVCAEDFFPGEALADIASPDEDLMHRVASTRDSEEFRRLGFAIAAQLLQAMRDNLPGNAAPRVLDWGCGSGRATRFMPLLWPALRLTGCDIDATAVEWCRAHIPGPQFDVTGPFPPLPYAGGAFDAVVASSVMTHLTADVQVAWLREVRRILAPGGVFVASVLGALSMTSQPASEREALDREGIRDAKPDPALDGVAPAGYYRSTFQTEAYTQQVWSPVLPVIEYRHAGLTNYQDLVIMRRKVAES